jgi:hypothetical protein
MGIFFRKSKTIAPGVRLNVTGRGVGLSLGRRGTRVSASTSGRRLLSLSARGFSFRKRL